MKKAWKDGTRAIVLQPFDLIARLCSMIPPPGFNMIRFHGVSSPNAKLRAEVVPNPQQQSSLTSRQQSSLTPSKSIFSAL